MTVATFYRFVRLDDPDEVRTRIKGLATSLRLKGTVLLAGEGINATLCGARKPLEAFIESLAQDPRFADLPVRYSDAASDNPVFYRLKVRVKPELVGFTQAGVEFGEPRGERVDARRWNELLDDDEVAVVDVRNGYEIGIGAFPGAMDPGIGHFRDFPDFARNRLDPRRVPKVAMYCTGGIRCEKASAWLINTGFREVYQLDGGILRYLETVPAGENRWQGECYVFDQRVSVDRELRQGTYRQCFACRAPVSASDRASPRYRQGVHCPHCFDDQSEARRAGLEERLRQVQLAEARGERHIGGAGD